MTGNPPAPPISPGILKLARQIHAKSVLESVAVSPGEGCLPGRCFQNVIDMGKRHGGAAQYGWRMREQAFAYVEGIFHAVWRRDDGILIDVTPRDDSQGTTLFLPDSRTAWTGDPVEPHRLMLNLQPCYCGSGLPFKICHGVSDD